MNIREVPQSKLKVHGKKLIGNPRLLIPSFALLPSPKSPSRPYFQPFSLLLRSLRLIRGLSSFWRSRFRNRLNPCQQSNPRNLVKRTEPKNRTAYYFTLLSISTILSARHVGTERQVIWWGEVLLRRRLKMCRLTRICNLNIGSQFTPCHSRHCPPFHFCPV